jgi:hypothetical protein
VANAALFLASEEANFVTGVLCRGRRTGPEHRLKAEITTRPSYAGALTGGVLHWCAHVFSPASRVHLRAIGF